MREVTFEEMGRVSGGLVKQLPPVVVTAPDPGGDWSGGGSGGASGGGDSGGGGGGGGSHSDKWGNLTPPTDTSAERNAIINQAFQILYDIGYNPPPGTNISYVDQYAFLDDKTGALRYSSTYNPGANESNVDGYTDPDGDIVITRDIMNSQDNGMAFGMYRWTVLEDDHGNPSINGTNVHTIMDGGITPLEDAVATLAHEFYHSNVVYHDGGHRSGTSYTLNNVEEERAQTQGFLAERAFNQAVLDENGH